MRNFQNGFLSALPPLTSLLLSFFFTLISMKIKYLMPPLYVKFMWNSIGMYILFSLKCSKFTY